jgi:hypothetical protein
MSKHHELQRLPVSLTRRRVSLPKLIKEMLMSANTLLIEVDHRGVATVTLNRPDVNNAYNEEMIPGLIDAGRVSPEGDGSNRQARCTSPGIGRRA